MFSIFIRDNKNGKVLSKSEKDKELIPISHKDFNEFIKERGFVGRNNYKLRDLKAMFGFKPLGSRVTITIDDSKEFNTYETISKASLAAGIPYTTLLQAKKKSKVPAGPGQSPKLSSNPVTIKSGGEIYAIKFGDV